MDYLLIKEKLHEYNTINFYTQNPNFPPNTPMNYGGHSYDEIDSHFLYFSEYLLGTNSIKAEDGIVFFNSHSKILNKYPNMYLAFACALYDLYRNEHLYNQLILWFEEMLEESALKVYKLKKELQKIKKY